MTEQTLAATAAPASAPETRVGGAGSFDYDTAFGRNLGWLTEAEQQRLRLKRVAIAGLGGVGGSHALTMARLGVGALVLADFDRFDLPNFNRQAGADVRTLGRAKVDEITEQVRAINPEADIRTFASGITAETCAAFLEGVDLVLDGLDFFALDVRRELFDAAYERSIPVITAAPMGMSTAYLVFTPPGMTFEDYFRLADEPAERQYVKFMLGLAPRGLHRGALVDASRVRFAEKSGPSTIVGCQLASGVVGGEALKLLLGRGRVRPAPTYHQFDAYSGRFVARRLRGGNANPLQRLKLAFAYRWIEKLNATAPPLTDSEAEDAPVTRRILDLARWAPSGDNEQPWRFEICGSEAVRIHVREPDEDNPYEFDSGRPIWLAVGALLETLRLAASVHGRRVTWRFAAEDGRQIDVQFLPAPDGAPHRLSRYIKTRAVDRRPYRAHRLRAEQKRELEAAWGDEFEVRWLENWRQRWSVAKLNARATHLRLCSRACHRVHRRVICFDTRYASNGLPAAAVGLDPLTVKLMQWANARWWRTRLLNGWLGGWRLASLQLDVLPGLRCAAHMCVRWRDRSTQRGPADWLRAGAAMQRFWLTAEAQGVAFQPGFAPLIFAHRARHAGSDPEPGRIRGKLADQFTAIFDAAPEHVVCLGRLGRSQRSLRSRSVRRNLSDLMSRTREQTNS